MARPTVGAGPDAVLQQTMAAIVVTMNQPACQRDSVASAREASIAASADELSLPCATMERPGPFFLARRPDV
jgi:hypothetical protein